MADTSTNLGAGVKQKLLDNGDGTHSAGARLQGGVGGLITVPNGSTNGTPIGAKPDGATGIRLYFPNATDSVTFGIVSAQPTAAPTSITISGADSKAWDELLAGAMNLYVTAKNGSPLFRWM